MNKIEELENKVKEIQAEIDKLKKEKEEKKSKIFKPKIGEEYWYICDDGNVLSLHYSNNNMEYRMSLIGNMFKTKEQAEEKVKWLEIHRQLEILADELNDGEEIDWSDGEQCKIRLEYSIYNQIRWNSTSFKIPGVIYCLAFNFKEKAIEKIGKEDLEFYLKY